MKNNQSIPSHKQQVSGVKQPDPVDWKAVADGWQSKYDALLRIQNAIEGVRQDALDRAEAAERERDLANRQYEGLRRIIDGASESMTHDDAVQELKVWRDDATALDRVKRERDAALARVRELEARVKAADRCEEIEQTAWDDLARANETIVHLAHRLAALEGKENRT